MPPKTRASSSILNATTTVKPAVVTKKANGNRKRKAQSNSDGSDTASDFEALVSPTKRAKRAQKSAASPSKRQASQASLLATESSVNPPPPAPRVDWNVERPSFLPATLSFSFNDAKQHLIKADPRFEDIFNRLSCKPFVKLDRVEPFRTLATSIIGQQISWKAARSVNWKFMRLFDDSLPEVLPPPEAYVPPERFPPPHTVADTDLATLCSAGLSARKAEYIQDLAKHFADGRLSAEKMWAATDEELHESLIAVRGVGPWTIDMFAIFSLRRPNILPVGDLGVQRGVLRWIISQHSSPESPIKLSQKAAPDDDDDKMELDQSQELKDAITNAVAATGSMAPPQTPKKTKKSDDSADGLSLPPPFTPSINRVLKAPVIPTPLPAGLTISELRARLNGKKKIKGALLTPAEMEALTESWKPYRSLGVYYMWALIDQDADE